MVVPYPGLTVRLRWWVYILELLTTVQYDRINEQFFSQTVLGH